MRRGHKPKKKTIYDVTMDEKVQLTFVSMNNFMVHCFKDNILVYVRAQ